MKLKRVMQLCCMVMSMVLLSGCQMNNKEIENTLDGKTFVFLGSSVTYGSHSGEWSMCEYIQENYDCTVVKWAVNGTTLVDTGDTSYVRRLVNNMNAISECDHFVCQLSTNDAGHKLPLGKMSSSKDINDFDTSTIIGAMEFIIATAQKQWDCPVSFYTGTFFRSDLYPDMVDALYELQEKWDIGIIDLWNDSEMRSVIGTEEYYLYMAEDGVHPTKLGYEKWWGPKFVEHLKKYD